MKYLLTAVVCIAFSMQVMAQKSNLIFFTEGGENFTLFVNGVKQNDKPASNVKAMGVTVDAAQIKVQFEEAGAPVLQQGMMIQHGMEMTALIKKNKKGKYVFRPVSAVPIQQQTEQTETVAITQSTQSTQSNPVEKESASVSQVTTTTTTTSASPSDASLVNVNVSEGENSMNMSVNINVNEMANVQTTVATSTTTTTSSNTNTTQSSQSAAASETPAAVVSNTCTTPMAAADFEQAKKAIANKSFAEDRMTVSKQILKNNCMSVKQVISALELFSYEASKLEFAKLAYPKTVDKGNYYQVNDSFSYSSSITELNQFLENQ